MRVSLARALLVKPALLLLDEPTNHLDLEACVWLEMELAKYNQCLVIISHSQDFLNGVCTDIIHLHERKLVYYNGNFTTFLKTRAELEDAQMKKCVSLACPHISGGFWPLLSPIYFLAPVPCACPLQLSLSRPLSLSPSILIAFASAFPRCPLLDPFSCAAKRLNTLLTFPHPPATPCSL